MKNKPIGMIDSGVGGLTVLKEAMKKLPNESFYYVADTAHCPYGSKSVNEIKQYVWEMVQFLLEKDIKMLVLACNTASAIVLDELKEKLSIPVIGVIQPGSQKAVQVTRNKKIAVLATEATIKNNAYTKVIKHLDQEIAVEGLACPSFVGLVESGDYQKPSAQAEVDRVLAPLDEAGMDTLVLGCTHYPLLRPLIEHSIGDEVQIVDSGVESVETIIETLKSHQQQAADEASSQVFFYTTGETKGFCKIGSQWLELEDMKVERIKKVK